MGKQNRAISFKTSRAVDEELQKLSKVEGKSKSKIVHELLNQKFFSRKNEIVSLPDKMYCPVQDKYFQIETLLVDGGCKRCPYSWMSFSKATDKAKKQKIKCPSWYPYGDFSYPPRQTLRRR